MRDIEQCCTRTSGGRLSQMTHCGVFTSVFSLVYLFFSFFSVWTELDKMNKLQLGEGEGLLTGTQNQRVADMYSSS